VSDPLADRARLGPLLRQTAEAAERYLESIDSARVHGGRVDAAAAAFDAGLPEVGLGSAATLAMLFADGADAATRSAGPRFFHFVTGGSTPAALAADWFASALDQNAFSWVSSPLGSRLEKVAAGWLKDLFELPPDWAELSKGLDAVLLSAARRRSEGWYDLGVVGICAWPKDPWCVVDASYYEDHKQVFARLGVPCETKGEDYLCKFSESMVRAYQLLHIFLHELGHHHDRMTTRRQRETGRGETYAEEYALRHEQLIWAHYADRFGIE